MAEKSTVARPYAEAVFSQAQDDGQLKEWSEMLQMARSVATDPAMAAIISNTSVNKQQLSGLFIEIIKDHCSEKGQNLIKVLAENRRLRQDNGRLRKENVALKKRIGELSASLESAERRAKRQAAPFSKGNPRAAAKRSGRKPGQIGRASCRERV